MSKVSSAIRKAFNAYAEINPNEDKEALLNVKMEFWDLMDKVDELEDENRDLKEQVRELEKQLATVKKIECINGAYYTWDDAENRVGPICYDCYMNNGAIYLLEQTNGGARCSVCKKRYVDVKTDHVGHVQQIW